MRNLRKDILYTLVFKFSLLAALWYFILAPQPKFKPTKDQTISHILTPNIQQTMTQIGANDVK